MLIDPNVASLLFLAGLAGIGFEIFHPGIVLPGALGVVALGVALYGLAVLPITWAAVPLVLLGIALVALDVHVVSHGVLVVAGLVSVVAGLAILFQDAPSTHRLSIPFAITVASVIGRVWTLVVPRAIELRRRPPLVGPQDVVGEIGLVRRGLVLVRGELWRASSDEPLDEGERVEVERLGDDLVLGVRKLPVKGSAP